MDWIAENWFVILSAAGIIGGLLFNAVSLRSETKTRRIANLLTVTANYREIWKECFRNPELSRVLDSSADVNKQPITSAEELFVKLIISHVNSVFYASNDELIVKWEALRSDIGSFFSLPVPNAVWRSTKRLQNQDFAAFIESSLTDSSDSPGFISPRISSLPPPVAFGNRSDHIKTKSWERGETVARS